MRKRFKNLLHIVLSSYVTTGISAGFGLLLIAASAFVLFGTFAASVATVGAIVCIPPDRASPRRNKFFQLLPAAVIGLPLFACVQVLHDQPLYLGLLLLPATFLAFLAGAWGKQGLPIVISIMFAMILSMALPSQRDEVPLLVTCGYFAMGATAYLLYATASNALLNDRYRAQVLAEVCLSMGALMRTQGCRFGAALGQYPAPQPGELMQKQAALADQLQAARNIVLESPRQPRRQQLAALLISLLEIRDHLLASELDLDAAAANPAAAATLDQLGQIIGQLAKAVEDVGDALLRGRIPASFSDKRSQLAGLNWNVEGTAQPGDDFPPVGMLLRGLINRVGNINDEIVKLNRLARGEAEPELAQVRTAWKLFVSPTEWSWRPFLLLWRWDAPPLRHALRAALAVGTGYCLSLALPWATHGYWILLTIVVVLRGSLSQTLERRDSRVAGTVLGCILAAGLLVTNPPLLLLLIIVPVAQAISHSFATRRYLVTSVSATVLSLTLAHLLSSGANLEFHVLERLGDTLIGAAIAWGFSYVLPSWERGQIVALVERTVRAQAEHARVALSRGQLQAIDDEFELEWRLARKEAFDSLSALVQATRRSLSEPRAVRPSLDSLEQLLTRGHLLLAQLTAIKSLLIRRGPLVQDDICEPMQLAAQKIDAVLTAPHSAELPDLPTYEPWPVEDTPAESLKYDLKPWILRRLNLSVDIAIKLRQDADRALAVRNAENREAIGDKA